MIAFYYGLVTVAVVMFSFMFLFTQRYEKESGNGIHATLIFGIFANITGFIILFIVNKFRFQFTPFSVITALVQTIVLILYYFCSIKAFYKINISLYSVICMLGGMVLPSIVGIILWKETITVGKIICFIAVFISLLLTVKKDNKTSGFIYYVGIFLLNGLYGVISAFYSKSDYPKAESAGYSAQLSLFCVILCSILLLFFKGDGKRPTKKAIFYSFGYGVLSNIGNFLSLMGLTKLPATAQCPFITGGTMIVSTIICFFTPNKPGKREIASVALAFAGIIALVLL